MVGQTGTEERGVRVRVREGEEGVKSECEVGRRARERGVCVCVRRGWVSGQRELDETERTTKREGGCKRKRSIEKEIGRAHV